MAAVLLQVLERGELNKLQKGAQNKLERFITELQSGNQALNTQHERFKADCDQQYFDVERRLAESQEKILTTSKDLQTVKEENKRLNEELSTLKGIEGNTPEDTPGEQSQSKAKYEIEAERRELSRLLEKRDQEVENLTEDVKRLNEKLMETSRLKMELQLKLDEIQSSELSIQNREKVMLQEKELLQKQKNWLDSELKTKTKEMLQTGREKGKEILELRCGLKSSKEQVTRLENQLSVLKDTSESRYRRAEDLNQKLKQSKDQQTAMEEKYRNELNARIKLSSLYKGAASEAEMKNKELSSAVEELTKLVKEAGEANQVLQQKVSEGEGLRTTLEAELKEKIKKMEKELENATLKAAGEQHCCVPSLTEVQLDSMCPSAAAIAEIVKPGMKFFELYNAYAECQSQFQLEKQESRRVSRVLDEIIQEVESKAPVLKRQREEYESMQRSMTSLCNKLELARTEIHSLQKEREEAQQQCSSLERNRLRTERQLEDTSTQVCTLLVELEEARGGHVTREDGSSADITSSSEIITPRPPSDISSPRHVAFRSVEELQRQNQSLIGRLREMEEEKERQHNQITSTRVTELEGTVEKLQKEVEQLREQRNQQKQLADSNARQRDMFRILLSQSTGFNLPPQGPESASQPSHPRPSVPATRSTPQRAAAEMAQTAQAKAALKQLNDAFNLYKKEKAENDKMMNETNDRLQKQLTELSSSKAKLASQLEFTNKRYELIQETVSANHREISALQERNHKMSATAQRHEHIIHTMSQDLRQANEHLASEQVRVENTSKERDMLRSAEGRLNREKEAVMSEQRNQNLLLTNLKSIQLTMERSETETRQRMNSQIERLEAELVSMKTKVDQEVQQRHALGRSMDAQLLEAKKQLETQNTLQQKTRELLHSSEQQAVTLRAQLNSASADPVTVATTSSPAPPTTRAGLRAPVRASPLSQRASQSEQELVEVRGRLRVCEEQRAELAEQLKSANSRVEQYKSVVLSLEDSLKKEKQFRVPLEQRQKEAEELQRQLERRILEAEKEKQKGMEERRSALDAVERRVSELQRSLKASQSDQREALERAAAAVTQEQKATHDSLLQTKLAGEAQAKYERELMLHAADVVVLQEVKKQVPQGDARRKELEEQLNKTSSLLQEKTTTWTSTEKGLKEDLSNQSRRCVELGKQNSLLHKQMDDMASKSKQQQQQQHNQQQQHQLNLSFSEEGKTTEQVLEILRFVRREKEIALTQCEVLEGETLRHKQRVEHQEKELKDLQDSLNSEREKMQATMRSLSQQEAQLKKMESVSVVQEANRMLKLDRDRLERELQQTQAKVSKLQADISPLQHCLSQLSERCGSLQAENRILDEDMRRWKNRAQLLTNQQKDSDVEERQKLTNEKEAQQRRIGQLTEEIARLKTELARTSATSTSAQSQLQALRDSLNKLVAERDTVKKELEAKTIDLLEKNKNITQVKKIGRRYKTQYEELKVQHDKLVEETAAKLVVAAAAGPSQEVQQELTKAQEELAKAKEEASRSKEEAQKRQEEVQKAQQVLEEVRQENERTKEQLQDVQTQLSQNQTQLTQVQNQLSQNQTQIQNQLTQSQKELQQAKTQNQQMQNQVKTQQAQAQARQNQSQLTQRELQQAKEALQQQNLASQKELQQAQLNYQQSHNQEVSALKTSLSQSEGKLTELQGQLDNLQKYVSDKETEIGRLQQQLAEANQATEASRANQSSQSVPASDANQANQSSQSVPASEANQAVQEELTRLRQEVAERSSREDQLRQQMTEKEEKTKKAFVGAKTKINQLNNAKEQVNRENEELKQAREEQEVRINALKSQYEGRLQRLERELRETQTHPEPREEGQEPSGSKEQPRAAEQRQISLRSPAQDRGSSNLSEPPTANIRPTPSKPSPSSKPGPSPGNKPSPSPGNKATPRASIRPMVTPATVSMVTPTTVSMVTSATVSMVTSATVSMVTPTATVMPTTQTDTQEVLIGVSGSVRCTSPGLVATPISLAQPTSLPTTAFVQPTQQQAANQEAASSIEVERPSTSSALIGAAGPKRSREEGGVESTQQTPSTKKLRLRQTVQEACDEELEGEMDEEREADDSQELPEDEGFPVLAEDIEEEEGGVSQSVPSDHMTAQAGVQEHDVIVIDTDSESRESREEEEKDEEEEEEEYKEEEDDEVDEDEGDDGGMGGGEESNEGSAGTEEGGDEDEGEEPDESTNDNEESLGGASSDSSHKASDPSHNGEGHISTTAESEGPRDPPHLPSSSPLTPRLPHSPRRPPHPLPPRLYIQPPAPELGPPHTQRQSQMRRPSVGRGPQLTPGIGTMQHFFDDDDRMVPSTPTLVVPHRTDGFAEAIHSPQVAGLHTRFRFGPPEDLLSQTSASHSDLGQLASQGGLGMYESPLFLAAHDEEGGGRSVPTTPLPTVSVFTESLPSDSVDNMASQSVPMVTTSTGRFVAPDDGDEVFMEQEGEGPSTEVSLDSQTDVESSARQDDSSQEPDSSLAQRRPLAVQQQSSILTTRGGRGGRGEARTFIRRGRGVTFSRGGGRGGAMGRGFP